MLLDIWSGALPRTINCILSWNQWARQQLLQFLPEDPISQLKIQAHICQGFSVPLDL